MSIRDRLNGIETAQRPAALADSRIALASSRSQLELRVRLHQLLLDRVDLGRLQKLSPELMRLELKLLTEQLIDEEQLALSENERRNLIRDIQYEMLGYGPLEPLLADPSISDILVNTHRQVYVERSGKLELTEITFNDDQHLLKIIDKIVSRVGRRIDESSPMVDARLPDGSRVNAIVSPLAIDGPIMSIRRFAAIPLKMIDIVELHSITSPMAELLAAVVAAKLNVLVSGGTGSGKTTLLNILSASIGSSERVVTIEDAAELQLQQPHVVRLETRPPNIEGKGEIGQRALVRNALRMRPDRILLGEVRGAEAFDMLQAMNTGHEGSMATVHANTPRDALSRLENMLSMAEMNMTQRAMRQQIASALTVIVQIGRMVDGQRKVLSIQEIVGIEGEIITMQEIYGFKQTGLSLDGAIQGYFSASGVRPSFMDRLKAYGLKLREDAFDPSRRTT